MKKTAVKRRRSCEDVVVKVESAEVMAEDNMGVGVFDVAASGDLDQSEMMSPMFHFTSNILDMITAEKEASSVPSNTRKAASDISANMLAAYQSVLNTQLNTDRRKPVKNKKETGSPKTKITNQSPTVVQRIFSPVPTTSVKGPIASTQSASASIPAGTSKPKIRPPRVIGGIADIRNQLLSKFTEVAATKDAPVKKQSLPPPSNNNSINKRPSPRITSETVLESICGKSTTRKNAGDNSKTGTVPKFKSIFRNRKKSQKKKVPPKIHKLPSKMAKQNIAFADPARKVAGAVESMFTSAISKVLKSQPTGFKKTNHPDINISENRIKPRLRRARGSKYISSKERVDTSESDTDEEDESDETQEKPPWENENDEDSDNYEENKEGIVKIEFVTDEQEPELESESGSSNLIILPGPAALNVNDENSSNDEDPLADASAAVVKVEEVEVEMDSTGVVGLIDEHNGDAQLFGDECTSEYEGQDQEADPTIVDVKPVLMPTIQMGTDIMIANSNVEIDSSLSTPIKIERVESIENSEDIVC